MCLHTKCTQHENKARKELLSLISSINEKYNGALIYIEEDLKELERYALWQLTNILCVTSLRDG